MFDVAATSIPTVAGVLTAAIVVVVGAAIGAPTTTRIASASDRCVPLTGTLPPSRTSARNSRAVVGALCLVGVFTIGFTLTAAVGAARFVHRRVAPILAARAHRRRAERELPEALDLFVLSVHAGLTPRQAISEVAVRAPQSVRGAFVSVIAQMERGQPLADALRVLHDELGSAAHSLADLLGSADRYGLPLGPVLEQLAAETRSCRRRLDEAAARSLPVKLSFPLVVCTLPSFVLLAIAPAVLAALSSLGSTAW